MKAIKFSSLRRALRDAATSLFFLLIALSTNAQQTKPLHIGDKLPDLVISGIINQTSDKVHLNELYKDRLLIIDFWATWCTPCLREMAFLDSLKAKNPNAFAVLMVSTEQKDVVERFLKRTRISHANLNIAASDTTLASLFPHNKLPHNIWVDQQGIIRAITSILEVNASNILTFKNRRDFTDLKTKKDNQNFSPSKEFHLGDSTFTYRSIISPYLDGIGGGRVGGSANGYAYNRYFQYNGTISSFFWDAYSVYGGDNGFFRYDLMEIHTRDSLRLLNPYGEMKHLLTGSSYKDIYEWKEKNLYSYALTLPNRVPDTLFRKYMFDDLERQFKVKATVENRNITCLSVTKTDGAGLTRAAGPSDSPVQIGFIKGPKVSVKNARIGDILRWWWQRNRPEKIPYPYVVDIPPAEDLPYDLILDFSTEVDPQIPGISTEMFQRKLQAYGFRFNKAIRPYPVLILMDLKE
jgi:thiol-disulfide isomerase/thioredoxin